MRDLIENDSLRETARLSKGKYLTEEGNIITITKIEELRPINFETNEYYNNYLYGGKIEYKTGKTTKLNMCYIERDLENSFTKL